MRQQHHVVGTLCTDIVHSLLHLLVERLRPQVVFQSTVRIVERIALQQHRLGCRSSNKGYLLVAILLDNVRHVGQLLVAKIIQIATHNGSAQLLQQHLHTRNAIVELMVAQRHGIVVHQLHDVDDVLSLRNGTRRVALQEITHTDGTSVCRIRLVDGIAQSGHLLIAVNAAVHVILVQNHNALLSPNGLQPHHKGCHTKKHPLFHSLRLSIFALPTS